MDSLTHLKVAFILFLSCFAIGCADQEQNLEFKGVAEIYFNYWDATSIMATDAQEVQRSFQGWASFDAEDAASLIQAVDRLQFSITPEGESRDARAILILPGKVGTKIVKRRFVADRFSVCEIDTYNCATSTPEFRDEITKTMAPYMRKW